jgi:hypothetical protein
MGPTFWTVTWSYSQILYWTNKIWRGSFWPAIIETCSQCIITFIVRHWGMPNKLEHLYMASLSRLVQHLQVKPEPTCLEQLSRAPPKACSKPYSQIYIYIYIYDIITHTDWLTEWGMLRAHLHFLIAHAKQKVQATRCGQSRKCRHALSVPHSVSQREKERCKLWLLYFFFKRNDGCLGTF